MVDDGGTSGMFSSSNTSSSFPPPSYYTKEQRTVMEECRKLHNAIMPLNDKIRGPLSPQPDQATALPFVLLLGNHSSGKSSFINYVLERNIQTTGVAPTDDTFTILAPGPEDSDQDGPAVVGDPDLGFAALRQFGPTLMHHVQLKIRKNIHANFLMVDTPGMIDAPSTYAGMLHPGDTQQSQHYQQGKGGGSSNNYNTNRIMDRGYDFTGVVRWLAHRADVVLLFFDPDKPGTTGETLSILLHSLSGMDHKLLIVLNKADQFSNSIHDFARAYGSLCWNLSKVIPRKDLPRIYTMCLPVPDNKKEGGENITVTSGLQDLFTARDEVVAEVRKAPARRMDNWITGLYDAVSELHMHAKLMQDIQQRFSKLYWQFKREEASLAVTGGGLTAALLNFLYGGSSGGAETLFSVASNSSAVAMVAAALGTGTMLGAGGLWWYHRQQMLVWQQQASKREELFQTFLRVYSRDVQEGDEYLAAIWQRVRPALAMALQHNNQGSYLPPPVTKQDLQLLQTILKEDIPRLRRMASPSHYGKDQ